MFRKVFFIVSLLGILVVPMQSVSAQLLSGSANSETSAQISVGTTTYDVHFPRAALQSAASRLQDVLYYLRAFDSDNSVIGTGTNLPYTSVSDIVFGTSAQVGVPSPSSVITPSTTVSEGCELFAQNLALGARGEEVVALQRFLNRFPQTRIAVEGPGSPGAETDYFGSLTHAAVVAFQAQFANEILVPVGLSTPTGYWGLQTRTYARTVQESCSS